MYKTLDGRVVTALVGSYPIAYGELRSFVFELNSKPRNRCATFAVTLFFWDLIVCTYSSTGDPVTRELLIESRVGSLDSIWESRIFMQTTFRQLTLRMSVLSGFCIVHGRTKKAVQVGAFPPSDSFK